MALIIEDGSNVANSNSYASEAVFEAFLAERGYTVSNESSILLIQAMDIIEAQSFKGAKTDDSQSLEFPRQELRDRVGTEYGGDEIPAALVTAQCHLAKYLNDNPTFTDKVDYAKSKKVTDVLQTEYAINQMETAYEIKTIKSLPLFYSTIKHLLASQSSGISGRVYR